LRLRGCAAALARLNYVCRLGEITHPTLLNCGDEDHGAPPENTRQMHAMIRGSRFCVIEQAGHIANIEQPDNFNEAVATLLADVR
jgi:3-oxoadipate enol-lactonase